MPPTASCYDNFYNAIADGFSDERMRCLPTVSVLLEAGERGYRTTEPRLVRGFRFFCRDDKECSVHRQGCAAFPFLNFSPLFKKRPDFSGAYNLVSNTGVLN